MPIESFILDSHNQINLEKEMCYTTIFDWDMGPTPNKILQIMRITFLLSVY